MEAARDHGKSYVFSYSWPLFSIKSVRDSTKPVHIALISYSEDQAKKNLRNIRKAIENKDELKWLMPTSNAYVWDASMLMCSNDCTIEAFGFGSSVRGGHYHKIIVDDPTKDHFSMSLAEQENFLFGVILPALRRGGQLVVCGNPVDKQDLLARLDENKEFKNKKYPAINERGEALWPERYPLEELERRRREIPTHIFAREYLLKRVSAADAKFKQDWIHYYEDEKLAGRPLFKVMTIDPAISPGGDALAAIVTGTDVKEDTYVLDRFSYRGDFKTGVGMLCDMMVINSPNKIGFENFAFQRMYKVWLEDELRRRGLSFYIEEVGRDSKRTKAMRIESLQPKLAQGKLYFKRDHAKIVDQLLLWDPLSKTNDDDEIDALAWQVGMWRAPFEDGVIESDRPKAGTFAEALEELHSGDRGYINKLFEDFS